MQVWRQPAFVGLVDVEFAGLAFSGDYFLGEGGGKETGEEEDGEKGFHLALFI